MSRFATCLAFTRGEEGRPGHELVDDPLDPGGLTNMGITIGALSEYLGHPASRAEVINLLPATAAAIYGMKYWNTIRGDDLPIGIDLMVFDFGVNAGVSRSSRFLQAAVGIPVKGQDGHIGPITLAAVRLRGVVPLINLLEKQQGAHYAGLPTFHRFGHGWMNRLSRRKAAALLAAGATGA